jgi:4-hydroxy-4-methyl-2-oxoglutarate aldolase
VLTIRRVWPRIEPKLLADFGSFSASQLSDAFSGNGAIGKPIQRLHGKGVVFGSALTVSTLGHADNLAPYAALKLLQPGDVVIIASNGCEDSALIGDNLVGMMRNAGAVAVITDGLIRDASGLEAIGLPVHAAGYSPKAPAKKGPGTVGLSIQIGQTTIEPGDLVVADQDGVVIVPASALTAALDALRQIESKDKEKQAFIRSGGKSPNDLDKLLAQVGVDWQ